MTIPQKDIIQVHGHRGWRGQYPENTIPGFIEACKLGVDALELDVVLTKDGEVLVSHDPYMHHDICLKPGGASISESEEKSINIYQMTLSEAQMYSCGNLYQQRFPDQILSADLYKPSLNELVDFINKLCALLTRQKVLWNIEIKSQPAWDFLFHPEPKRYVELFLSTIFSIGISDNCVIQSFDSRILEELHLQSPEIRLIYLSDKAESSAKNELSRLSFKPFGFSPNFKLMCAETAYYCRQEGIEMAVWTVNEESDMMAMAALGVKHLITDFPDKAMKVFNPDSAIGIVTKR